MSAVMDLVTAVRNIRGEMRITPAQTLAATVRPSADAKDLYAAASALIETLARVQLTVDPRAARSKNSGLAVIGGSELYVDLTGVDVAAERQRIEKEIRRITDAIGFSKAKLAKPEFVERAPEDVVARERERLAENEGLHAKLVASLAWIDDGSR